MRRLETYIIAGLLFLTVFSDIGWTVDNYINPATIPPSLRREGLIRSPAQVYGSGNQLVTGNIRGPAYFRGVVPYSAPTDFGQTLPSSSLDLFLRDSAGTEDFGRYNRYLSYNLGYRPYYSQTQTVASTIPGASVVAGAQTANISDQSGNSYLGETLPMRRDEMLDPASARSLTQLRPMSMTPTEMQKLISSEIAKYSPDKLSDQQYQAGIEQPTPDMSRDSYNIDELKKILMGPDSSLLSSSKKTDSNLPTEQKERKEEKNKGTFLNAPEESNMDRQLDVYDSMKQQLDSIQKKIESEMIKEQQSTIDAESAKDQGSGKPEEKQTKQGSPAENLEMSNSSQAEKLAEVSMSVARTRAILGPYETFASFSQDKFNQNMRAGEYYLKQGKFYLAADAYTLASLYKPDDPLAYAGKSHALFASGEYMSSALFLSRALQIFPEYARFKIDIVAMVGSRDTLESRVANIQEWLGKSSAPELQFLLAYVYYQMDRRQPAKEAIDQACKLMPDAPAVLALKKAIEESPVEDKNTSQRITDSAVSEPNK